MSKAVDILRERAKDCESSAMASQYAGSEPEVQDALIQESHEWHAIADLMDGCIVRRADSKMGCIVCGTVWPPQSYHAADCLFAAVERAITKTGAV